MQVTIVIIGIVTTFGFLLLQVNEIFTLKDHFPSHLNQHLSKNLGICRLQYSIVTFSGVLLCYSLMCYLT